MLLRRGLRAANDAIVRPVFLAVVTVGSILAVSMNALALPVNMLFSLPVIGLILHLLLRLLQQWVMVLGAPVDMILCRCGIMPEKRLRLRIVVLRDEDGVPVCDRVAIIRQLAWAISFFKRHANIALVPIRPCVYGGIHRGSRDWGEYICVDNNRSATELLDCRYSSFTLRGRARRSYNRKVCSNCFWGNWRRLSGFGAPVCVFAIRRMSNDRAGLCPMLIADCALVVFNARTEGRLCLWTLAHEIGHTCGLRHSGERQNIMSAILLADSPDTGLSLGQIIELRISPHVSYF